MAPTIDITSIGAAAIQLQRTPKVIRQAADTLHIAPAFVIDDKPHYASQDVERIAEHLAGTTTANDLRKGHQGGV